MQLRLLNVWYFATIRISRNVQFSPHNNNFVQQTKLLLCYVSKNFICNCTFIPLAFFSFPFVLYNRKETKNYKYQNKNYIILLILLKYFNSWNQKLKRIFSKLVQTKRVFSTPLFLYSPISNVTIQKLLRLLFKNRAMPFHFVSLLIDTTR